MNPPRVPRQKARVSALRSAPRAARTEEFLDLYPGAEGVEGGPAEGRCITFGDGSNKRCEEERINRITRAPDGAGDPEKGEIHRSEVDTVCRASILVCQAGVSWD